MFNALSDFLIYCRVERRLAELTCKAYERDVRACLDFLRLQARAKPRRGLGRRVHRLGRSANVAVSAP